MVWSKLKPMLSKLRIDITKIFALEEEYEVDRKLRLKSDKIEKILIWLVLQNQMVVRAFFGTF